jgi:hypothetical protein
MSIAARLQSPTPIIVATLGVLSETSIGRFLICLITSDGRRQSPIVDRFPSVDRVAKPRKHLIGQSPAPLFECLPTFGGFKILTGAFGLSVA